MRTAISSSTTIRTGLGIFALGGACVTLLIGCGGGDAVVAPTTTTTATATTFLTSSGAVTATFNVALPGAIRYFVQGSGESDTGTTLAGNIVQDPSTGIVSNIGSNVLAGTPTFAVQKIQGDASFAIGRWTRGSATVAGNVKSLTGTDYKSVHYLVMHELQAGIADGTYVCGRVKSDLRDSGLTYGGGASPAPASENQIGAFAPYATIAVTGGGASAIVSLQEIRVVGAGVIESGYNNQTLTFSLPASTPQQPPSSDYLAGNEGLAFILGRDSNPLNINLGVAYRGTMSGGARYQGIVSVICSP